MGYSQDVPDNDCSFSVSPLSPGLFFQPPRGSTSPPAGGALLPMTTDDCVVSGLGDPITDGVRGQNSPCLCLYVWPSGLAFLPDPPMLPTGLASGISAPPPEGSFASAPPMDSGEGG